jgi:hypothetical protein
MAGPEHSEFKGDPADHMVSLIQRMYVDIASEIEVCPVVFVFAECRKMFHQADSESGQSVEPWACVGTRP